ncbi:MAG: hypothetical protein ACLR6B_13735 [Blautia sp.]
MKKIWKKTGILLLALLVFLMPLSLKSQAAAAKPQKLETQCSKGISAAGEKDHLKSQSSNAGDSVKSVL